jgi:hypothetical protein
MLPLPHPTMPLWLAIGVKKIGSILITMSLYYITALGNSKFLKQHGGAKFKYHHLKNNSTIEGLAMKVIS